MNTSFKKKISRLVLSTILMMSINNISTSEPEEKKNVDVRINNYSSSENLNQYINNVLVPLAVITVVIVSTYCFYCSWASSQDTSLPITEYINKSGTQKENLTHIVGNSSTPIIVTPESSPSVTTRKKVCIGNLNIDSNNVIAENKPILQPTNSLNAGSKEHIVGNSSTTIIVTPESSPSVTTRKKVCKGSLNIDSNNVIAENKPILQPTNSLNAGSKEHIVGNSSTPIIVTPNLFLPPSTTAVSSHPSINVIEDEDKELEHLSNSCGASYRQIPTLCCMLTTLALTLPVLAIKSMTSSSQIILENPEPEYDLRTNFEIIERSEYIALTTINIDGKPETGYYTYNLKDQKVRFYPKNLSESSYRIDPNECIIYTESTNGKFNSSNLIKLESDYIKNLDIHDPNIYIKKALILQSNPLVPGEMVHEEEERNWLIRRYDILNKVLSDPLFDERIREVDAYTLSYFGGISHNFITIESNIPRCFYKGNYKNNILKSIDELNRDINNDETALHSLFHPLGNLADVY